jgi:5-methyltetrahydropteroyltriglutamate--homocysteine methyltransferase
MNSSYRKSEMQLFRRHCSFHDVDMRAFGVQWTGRRAELLRSIGAFLTTHVGSLPRPDDLLTMMITREDGGDIDPAVFAARANRAVEEVVKRQVDLGIDVVNDGEQGKVSFITYVGERLSGIVPGEPRGNLWKNTREGQAFPEFYAEVEAHASGAPGRARQMICVDRLRYSGRSQLDEQLRVFRAAADRARTREAFVPSISPSNVERWQRNDYYKSDDDYLEAIAEAMRVEYEAIVGAGFLLQIDDPAMATRYTMTTDSLDNTRKWANVRVDVLNHALRNIAEENIRFHTCYSINMGPRSTDMELKDLVDIMLRVRAGAYSFEFANPRHEHEWKIWESVKLPTGRILIPGVISHTTVLVEHPELVAERILRFANVVGPENVIAGADCGFASFAASHEMHPSIVWAKLAALVEGANIASRRVWN